MTPTSSGSTGTQHGTESTSARSWLSVGSIALGSFVLVTTEFLPIGLLGRIAADMGVSDGTAGLMVTVPGLVAAVAAPAVTIAAGRIDRRLVLWALLALLAISNLTATLAPNFAVMLVGRVLLGIGVGGFWAFAAGLGVRLVPAASGGRATAIILAGISIGTVLGVPAGAWIGEVAGWRSAFAVTGTLAVLALIGQWLLLPRLPVDEHVRLRSLMAVFSVPLARVGLVATTLLIGGHFAAYTYLQPLLARSEGVAASLITPLLLTYGLAGLVGTFAGEAAIARSLRGALVGTSVVLGLTLLLAPFIVSGPVAAFIFVAIWGAAFGAVPLCLQTWMMRASPAGSEGGLALFVSVLQVALAVGSGVGGMVVDSFGVAGAMSVGSLFALTAGLVVFAFGAVAKPLRSQPA
ncbi:MAG: transporter [Rhizobacter sp.]|nr:transporter [Rhizobacter sp.]